MELESDVLFGLGGTTLLVSWWHKVNSFVAVNDVFRDLRWQRFRDWWRSCGGGLFTGVSARLPTSTKTTINR